MPNIFEAAFNNDVSHLKSILLSNPNMVNYKYTGNNDACDRGAALATLVAKKAVGGTGLFLAAGGILGGAIFAPVLIAVGSTVVYEYGNKTLKEISCEKKGWTALHFAAVGNAENAAEYLISHGADVENPDVNGKTCIDIAKKYNHKSFVARCEAAQERQNENQIKLLNKKKKIKRLEKSENVSVKQGKVWQQQACSSERKNLNLQEQLTAASLKSQLMYQRLEEAEKSRANVLTLCEYLSMPLTQAIQEHNLPSINAHLASSTGINDIDENGSSPLFYACKNNMSELVEALLQRNAYSFLLDNEGNTLLHSVVLMGHYESAAALLKYKNNSSLCHIANKKGDMPLHIAVKKGDIQLVKLLLKSQAPVNECQKEACESDGLALPFIYLGCAPIHLATLYNHTPIIDELLEAGANIEQLDMPGRTAMHIAVSEDTTTLQFLLDKKLNVDLPGDTGWTPLHEAAYFGYENAIKLLLQHGANPNAVNRWAQTPAMLAHESPVLKNKGISSKHIVDLITSPTETTPVAPQQFKFIQSKSTSSKNFIYIPRSLHLQSHFTARRDVSNSPMSESDLQYVPYGQRR